MFNARQYREENPLERSLPEGWYKVKCETSELKKSSTGFDMVTLSIRIADSLSGHFINALQWENLVIGHPNETTRKFANEKLAEIMLASGVDEITVWGDIAHHGADFAMRVAKSEKTGRVYSVYRDISAWDAAVNKHYNVKPEEKPDVAPAPPIEHYIDDIPY